MHTRRAVARVLGCFQISPTRSGGYNVFFQFLAIRRGMRQEVNNVLPHWENKFVKEWESCSPTLFCVRNVCFWEQNILFENVFRAHGRLGACKECKKTLLLKPQCDRTQIQRSEKILSAFVLFCYWPWVSWFWCSARISGSRLSPAPRRPHPSTCSKTARREDGSDSKTSSVFHE